MNSTSAQNALCNELLSLIEIDEAKLLNWGFFDVRSNLSATLKDYVARLPLEWHEQWKSAESQGFTEEKALNNLLKRSLIFRFNIAGQIFYRTRFGETIRLLYLLRQRFSPKDWYTASKLVSDLKIQLQRRRYPLREIESADLLQELRDLRVPALYIDAITCLLQSSPGIFIKLARFQKEAIIQHFRNMRNRGERAVTIGAGTGSGKTKAFYIPAMAEVATNLPTSQNKRWVQVLAIYPRTELLKDQLQEAFSEARKLDEILQKYNKRGIVVAAYYGDTPTSAERFLRTPLDSWSQNETKDGWVCPFFSCPQCGSQELTWYRRDIEREQKENQRDNYTGKYARLICPNPHCRTEITSQQLQLTREQMIRHPPDILFTTTEMLNRRMSRSNEHHLFGLSPNNTPPRLVLLDEIHTYEGTQGAQTAYLLRRWKYARGKYHQNNIYFVGLSATLNNAEAFFSKLTGVPVYQVHAITPREQDLIEEGLEYNVVLKGDPVSGTSLLSTSVQTVMLLGRMLDLDSVPSKEATYGKKIFAFADKLDVLNRWYHIEKEAESLRTLSQYRDYSETDKETRRKVFLFGQDWLASQKIGHDLRTPLRLDLTSSQYRGVNAQANFIIATSTLEVGFNDPDVGMVIQHKAPRSMASFLQRKGRAGRQRHMRPWMVVVTSAYGRDRWAFQHTEQIFHPQLEALNLPIDNYYVRKIQATYTLMDWLAAVLTYEKEYTGIDIWQALSSKDQGTYHQLQRQRQAILDILNELLRGKRRHQFQEYLMQALDIHEHNTIHSLLWGEPRSLFFEVIPTVMRQLASNWQSVQSGRPEQWKDSLSENPMPEFMPPNLFSDLNLPELLLRIPEQPTQKKSSRANSTGIREDVYLPMIQALHEFAPGHVNKRYSRKQFLKEAHWLALPKEEEIVENKLPLHLLSIERSPYAAKRIVVDQIPYEVFQPRAYILSLVPDKVKTSSNGHLVWRSHFAPMHISDQSTIVASAVSQNQDNDFVPHLSLAPNSPWKKVFRSIDSYTQLNGHWVEITRLATGVTTETFYKDEKDVRRTLTFEEHGKPAALGFTIYTDALCFTFEPLDVKQILSSPAWNDLYHHLGPEYFLHKLQHDQRLSNASLTSFEINWLWQLELSMIIAVAITQQYSLTQSAQEVQRDRERLANRAMKVIFQSLQTEEDDDDGGRVGRLHKKLIAHMTNPIVQAVLQEHEQVLWNKEDPQFVNWLHSCYASSLGAAVFAALVQLLPDINAESLIMDVEGNRIWITEETGGGIGLISRIAETIALRPGEFDLQMQDTLEYCEREQLAIQLQTVTQLVDRPDPELLATFAKLRENMDLPQQMETRNALTKALEKHGIAATRNLIVGLNAKFLRPNSSPDTDKLIVTLVRYWQKEEQRIGCAIDLRVMAVAALRIPEIRERITAVLQRIGGENTKIDESQVFNLLQSLLWLDCHDSCPDCIYAPQLYQTLVRPSRSLLLSTLRIQNQPVLYGSSQWKDQILTALTAQYHVYIKCEQTTIEDCKRDLLSMLTEPIEIGYQFYYPMIERIALDGQHWLIHLHIREFLYA